MSLPQKHREETEKLVRLRSSTKKGKRDIANWLLNEGYYPEQYVLPPCFEIQNFNLDDTPKISLNNLTFGKRKSPANISFPKTDLVDREFGVIHPKFYHDIVYHLISSWHELMEIWFDQENEIYSYSFPIPLNSGDKHGVSNLRTGRMIYEFLEMAEKDLVCESHKYNMLVSVDITNFYNSVYTHSISWAWFDDREEAAEERGNFNQLGNQLDKLFQYANDARTSGLPVGPVVSDLVIELLLCDRDKLISRRLKKVDFIATRFKDDYKFLAKTKEDAEMIIKAVMDVLGEFNLQVNEEKTQIDSNLPDSLYRPHNYEYEQFSLKKPPFEGLETPIPFKVFETTLLKTIEIHRKYPGTGIIDKFLSQLRLGKKRKGRNRKIYERIRIEFVSSKIPNGKRERVRKTNVRKTLSLLIELKNESPKSLGNVLSIIECLYLNPINRWLREEKIVEEITKEQIKQSILQNSAFELIWWLYFLKRHELNLNLGSILKELRDAGLTDYNLNTLPLVNNAFVFTLRGKKPGKGNINDPFEGKDHSVEMFTNPIDCGYLLDHLDIFNRDKEIPEN